MKKNQLLTVLFFQFFCTIISAQGGATSCANLQNNFQAYQSCATAVPFTNQTTSNSENIKPSCFLQFPKAPTWFFIKIKNTGNVELQISQISNLGNPIDVDFALWGPFATLSTSICSQLNVSTQIDCSYSPEAIEPVSLPNGIQGQYYILMVDNYDQVAGTISIEQTGGTGSSDCSFLSSVKIKDIANNDITQYNYCKPASKDLKAVINTTDFTGNLADLRFNYRWSRNGVVLSTVNNAAASFNILNASQTGLYKIEIAAYDSSQPGININNIPFLADQTAEIDLKFYETATLNTATTTANVCDLTAPNNDGITSIDLTQFYNNVTNSTPGISLRYYRDAGLTQQISAPNNFVNNIPNVQNIYVVGEVSGQPYYCPSNVAIIQLSIAPTSLSVYSNISSICPELNQNFGYVNFDAQRLIIKNTFFPSANVNIQFYDSAAAASLDQNPLSNGSQMPVGSTTIYTKVKSGVNCSNVGIFNVAIKSAPILNTFVDVKICSYDNFLLSSKDIEALLGQSSTVQASYHLSVDDAKNNANAINKNINFAGNLGENKIFVRLYNTATQCFSIVNFVITIFPRPNINPSPLAYAVCGNGTGNFNLLSRANDIMGNSNYVLTFYETIADVTTNNPILNVQNYVSVPKTLVVLARDTNNNNCETQTTLQLLVYTNPGSSTNPTPFLKCNSSGFDSFDLTSKQVQMTGGMPISDLAFKYYENATDAVANNGSTISNPSLFTNTFKNYQKIYVRINNVNPLLFCYSILEIEIFVGEYPIVNIGPKPYYICKNTNNVVLQEAFVDTKLIPQIYSFQWFINSDAIAGNEIVGETGSTFSTPIEGSFSVKITNYSAITNCVTIVNFTTKILTTPTVLKILPDEIIAFSQANTVTVSATPPSAEYEYQLNFGIWQSSTIFNDLKPGRNTVQVRNSNGCDEISAVIIVADFKSFFTPNGDSFNDFWKIDGDAALDITATFVYDRYGKLLYEHKKSSPGWDGTFNGQTMPADDYWFKIIYSNNGVSSQFKGHFALKR